ncbi:Na/Pi cotransporter family protein [Ammoniphilus sp. CFH 90114]|nr:Na/Pi cotransporter family protein [Ammoniphilus sp. CFH 90114]RXT00302.1 Na/Pi cotransporter family protein [Ammoniphilus sp. CFH 90114]
MQDVLFKFLGGLGIFLFGIKYMGDGLEKSAGDRLRDILEKMTTNPIKGVLAGIIVTVLLQTSSGTTVLAVGFVNAGLMTLRQAIGVIMGANIGTTVTAFIIGIKIENYALPIIAAGAILLFFFKKKRLQYMGQIVFGFGMLFYGLKTMGGGLKPLKDLPIFHEMMVDFAENPLLGVIFGTVFTVIVQSSSATIGILQQLASEGGISLKAALPILFGDNIGTTITAMLAAIGASIAAKRAALTHVIFNLLGTFIAILLLPLFYNLVYWLGEVTQVDVRMQIAYAHGIFNFTNVFIQLPFIGVLAYIVTKIYRDREGEIEFGVKNLDPRFLDNPSVAIGQAEKELLRMANLTKEMLRDSTEYFYTGNEKLSEATKQREDLVDLLEEKIIDYMTKAASEHEIPDTEKYSSLMYALKDIERMGDHSMNIVELAEYRYNNKLHLSEEANQELREMVDLTSETMAMAIKALEDNDKELAMKVVELEEKVDKMERQLRKTHLKRLNEGVCTGGSGVVFLDIISNLERMADHSMNIAQYVLGEI